MKTSTITKTLGVLALLGSSVSMAATVNIIPSNAAPLIGQQFTLTLTSDFNNTFAGTMALSFNAATVAFVGGAMPATGPWSAANGGAYIKNSPTTANPTVFDIVTNVTATGATVDTVILTFQAIAGGAANIVINDDGGNCCGFFTADTADYIPATYNQADVQVVPVPAAAWLFASAIGGIAGLRRRK